MTLIPAELNSLRTLVIWIALVVITAAPSSGEDPIDFNRDIRPLLSNHCLTCHGPDEAERVTDLRLDTESGSRIDLGGYAAIVPGKPEQSDLIERLISDDVDLRMPPEGKGRRLTTAEVDRVRRWIEQGAHYAKHWSYQNPVRPDLPATNNPEWPRNGVDHFVLARLESQGLVPAPEADRWTLARRVALDLTGLPPSWDEAQQFVEDRRDDAYQRYVDHQLAKQSFGERWARVWLDLARYADSAGYADDPPRTIWAYRDYVIRSLNDNKPFDQFTIEQIAGDLLPSPTDQQLVATAFHRNTLTNNEGGTNDEEFRNVAVVDRVNTTMAVWMGTTMACAQCHTHKYDPITQEEYFQFFAFFNNSRDADQRDERPTMALFGEQQQSEQQRLRAKIEEAQQLLERPTPKLRAAQQAWLASLQREPDWQGIVPTGATGKHRELAIAADGSVRGVGNRPNSDQYDLVFETAPGPLTGLKIDVPADQSENFVLSKVTASWAPADNDSVSARFVRIELPGDNRFLHVAEVQAFADGVNVAQRGVAKQSSTAYRGDVKRAIDGNTDGDFTQGSVTHTAQESNPWLEIDLGAAQEIDQLVIWNRLDGGRSISDRIQGLRLSLLDDQRDAVWRQSSRSFPEPSQSYSINGIVELNFGDAVADFQQQGFPASSVLVAEVDPETGWAIAPRIGKPHQLVLSLAEPFELEEGELTVRLIHQSKHQGLLLDHFQLSMTTDPNLAQWSQVPLNLRPIIRKPAELRTDSDEQALAAHFRSITPMLDPTRKRLDRLREELADIKPMTTVPVMRQVAESDRRSTKVQIRGNYQSTGKEVSEGTPAVFHPLPADMPRDRLALAHWLVDEQNPLTARVTVNRHWEEIFGTGIVESSEEFGSQGELPSHPQLLDWLAVELREGRWNLKELLRLLVTSATYRQSSVVTAEQQELDPGNRWYSRGPRFRISAEMVRDQSLFVSGLLTEKMYGPPVRPPQPELGLSAAFGSKTDWTASQGVDRYRRGLYTSWRRSSPYPSMAQFDAPNREVCTVRRIRTNTPLQALVTLNDPVFVEAAQALARTLIGHSESPAKRIEYAFQVCLIRQPTGDETDRLSDFVRQSKQHFDADLEQATKLATIPRGDLPPGADPAEYAAWTAAANVILNLDEMFLKR